MKTLDPGSVTLQAFIGLGQAHRMEAPPMPLSEPLQRTWTPFERGTNVGRRLSTKLEYQDEWRIQRTEIIITSTLSYNLYSGHGDYDKDTRKGIGSIKLFQ